MARLLLAMVGLLVVGAEGHVNKRWRGTHDKKATGDLAEDSTYWDSRGGCAKQCMKNADCAAFTTLYLSGTGTNTFQGFRCNIYKTGYSASTSGNQAGYRWVLWEVNTADQPPRVVETVPAATSPPECPVVHRMWPSDNSTIGAFSLTSSGEDGGDGTAAVFDSTATTMFRSNKDTFPWLQVDLGRNYRVTKVALQSGAGPPGDPGTPAPLSEQLMNVDIRLGPSDQSGAANNRITGNTRCGIYYGPTLVANQWVEVDCGYDRGLMGRYLTIQSTERFQASAAMELAEVEVHGWARVCGTEDPDY